MGLGEVLTVLFVALKLTGYISWSWWWVTSPLWLVYGIVFILLLIQQVLKNYKL